MTLEELRDLLVDQVQNVSPAPIPLLELAPYLEQIPGKLYDLHGQSESLHAAIDLFARTGDWPSMSDIDRTMLVHRLNYAISVLDILTGGWQRLSDFTFPDPNFARDDLISWALKFMWNEGGFPLLEGLANGLHSRE